VTSASFIDRNGPICTACLTELYHEFLNIQWFDETGYEAQMSYSSKSTQTNASEFMEGATNYDALPLYRK
jgi:hypothetical protein